MDEKISGILRMLDNYEGNEKGIFKMIQAEAMVKYKQCEEMIGSVFTCGVSYGTVQIPVAMISKHQLPTH
ncbi:hypothetical protein LSF16_23745 [Bacillus cereus]|uniref:hypothetical protein n=1 Tax=Bacillus cereus TaxID=1396 RepID=UPI001F2B2B7A|nr:hypothetical protein [Bacillus cereus]UJA78957.1 hypothetical protein LSF16_23745 [Bacillus cereus]